MPQFQLPEIPGVRFESDNRITIGPADPPAHVAVRFTGGLLATPPDEGPVEMEIRYGSLDAGIHTIQLTLLSTLKFLAEQMHLSQFMLDLLFRDAPDGPFFDPLDGSSVNASGLVEWHGLPPALSLPGDKLDLSIRYDFQPGGSSRFALALPGELALSAFRSTLKTGELQFEVLPDQNAFGLLMVGEAEIMASEHDQIEQILNPVFGSNVVRSLLRPSFRYQERFELSGGQLPDRFDQLRRLSMPFFQINFPSWLDDQSNDNTPTLQGLPDGLAIKLGLPQLTGLLPSLDNPFNNWQFSLRDCDISFPDFPRIGSDDISLDGVRLFGDLGLKFNSASDWQFKFTPTINGGFDLPQVLNFIARRIEWVEASLSDLAQATTNSVIDLDWQGMFTSLLDGLDPSAALPSDLLDQIKGMLDSALSNAGLPFERAGFLAFNALSGPALRVPTWQTGMFDSLWKSVLDRPSLQIPDLTKLLSELTALPVPNFQQAMSGLFQQPGFDLLRLSGLFGGLMEGGLSKLNGDYNGFLFNFTRVLDGAIASLPAPDIAGMINDLWDNGSAALNSLISLPDSRFISGSGGSLGQKNKGSVMIMADALGELFDFNLRKAISGENLSANLPSLSDLFNGAGEELKKILPNGFSNTSTDAGKVQDVLLAMINRVENAPPNKRPQEEAKLIAAARSSRKLAMGLILNLAVKYSKNLDGIFKEGFNNIIDIRETPITSPLPEKLTLKLPAPVESGANSRKYLILSDVHRDSKEDGTGDFADEFKEGGIDHFQKNAQLYFNILKYAQENGYTVIEGGDCEELWFIKDLEEAQHPDGFKRMLERCIRTYSTKEFNGDPDGVGAPFPAVFNLLRELHREARYFRIYGNHDSYLRRPEIRQPLVDFMQRGSSMPFFIFDNIIIPGVKTLRESPLNEYFSNDSDLSTALGKIFVGLDSRVYQDKKPLLVTHGHQWDFWNCDEHSLLGKLMANSVVPIDMAMDPWIEVEGVAIGGEPTIDIAEIAAAVYPLNSWPAKDPAVNQAYRIKAQSNADRLLRTAIAYSETLAALHSTYRIRVDGQEKSLLCIGHTHNPHSGGNYGLIPILEKIPLLMTLLDRLILVIPLARMIRMRSNYHNSGTAGWWEGVVWAIEIHETGQARLCFWTDKLDLTKDPEYMNWELYPWDPAKRQKYEAAQPSRRVKDYLRKTIASVGDSIKQKMQGVLVLTQSFLDRIITQVGGSLEVLGLPNINDPESLLLKREELEAFLAMIFASWDQMRSDPAAASKIRNFMFEVPLTNEHIQLLRRVEDLIRKTKEFVFSSDENGKSNLLRAAVIWASTAFNLKNLQTGSDTSQDKNGKQPSLPQFLPDLTGIMLNMPEADHPQGQQAGLMTFLSIDERRRSLVYQVRVHGPNAQPGLFAGQEPGGIV